MDTKIFDDYQKEFSAWQKKFVDTWITNLPNAKDFKMPDNMDKGIEMQQELVTQYLDAQETAIKLSLETQKKFWDGYFDLMRKTTVEVKKVAAVN